MGKLHVTLGMLKNGVCHKLHIVGVRTCSPTYSDEWINTFKDSVLLEKLVFRAYLQQLLSGQMKPEAILYVKF